MELKLKPKLKMWETSMTYRVHGVKILAALPRWLAMPNLWAKKEPTLLASVAMISRAINISILIHIQSNKSGYWFPEYMYNIRTRKQNTYLYRHCLSFVFQTKIFDFQKFNMSKVKLVKVGDIYILEVPGLAEKRPSLLRGKYVNVSRNSVRCSIRIFKSI